MKRENLTEVKHPEQMQSSSHLTDHDRSTTACQIPTDPFETTDDAHSLEPSDATDARPTPVGLVSSNLRHKSYVSHREGETGMYFSFFWLYFIAHQNTTEQENPR
jgi:hypothetical protein